MLCRAQQSAHKRASYRIRTTNTDAGGTAHAHTVEPVRPDRERMHDSSSGGGEVILVGKDSYVPRGADAWQKTTMDMIARAGAP